jgi:VIT1/CCC1 family predicted Fe2+/Mn2+ transporter
MPAVPATPAPDDSPGSSRRLLEPIDHTSEILFGLIMVMTCTGSLSVADAGRAEVRTMLFAALGCNLAWGVIDAVFYLMGCLAETAGKVKLLNTVRSSTDPAEAKRALAGALPPLVASVLAPAELETMRLRLKALPETPDGAFLSRNDWLGAAGVFFLVFLSTFPVVIPFIFMKDITWALRISNGIAIVLLFVTGYYFGRSAGRRKPARTGFAMVVIGAALVGLTIALGG